MTADVRVQHARASPPAPMSHHVPAAIRDVGAWLDEHELGQYAPLFAEQNVDGDVLASLTDADLKELGVTSLGHRKKLLLAIASLAGGAHRAAGASAAAPDGERRQATVLFADLAGYTTLTRELGSEEMHALTDRFFAAADRAIVSHGGTIDKRIGDCVMAVFGAPIAHGDDPERAVRAALAIRAAMPELGRGVGRVLNVHIGVAVGQIVASTIGTDHHRQYSITGDSVNLAARLTSRAGDDEILLSDELRTTLGERLDAEPMEPLEVKGFDRPVRPWRLTGVRTAPPAHATPFVGRHTEVAHVLRSLDTCRDSGRGMAILVRGEAGIGKSRLIAEIARLAGERGFTCHKAAALDFGAGAERNPIRALASSLGGAEAAGDAVERAFMNDLLGAAQPPELAALTGVMDHATRRNGRIDALAKLVRRASAAQPTLVVVEDVHWADEPTLDHLARLCSTVADCRAALVMTSRVEGDPLGAAWRSKTHGSGLLTIDLGPLRESDAAALAGSWLDATSPLAQSCIARANGNPLFLEQLLRHAHAGSDDIPGTVHSVVLARADKLAPTDRAALQAAAVLGQRLALPALRHLIDDDTYSPEALIEHVLVRPDGDELVFLHALIRDGVYAALLRPAARGLHLRAAAWYRDREPTVYAEHLDRAGDPEAASAYTAAARNEARAQRLQHALELIRRGAACATTPNDTHALAALEAEVRLELADAAGTIDAASRALELAASTRQLCGARLSLAAGMRLVDRLDDAFAVLQAAEPEAAAEGLAEELARIYYLRGCLCFPQGRLAECRASHERALGCAREAGSVELQARALSGIGDAEYMSGRYRTAAQHFADCLELARRHALGKVEVANRGMLAITRWFAGGADALEEADAAIDAARRANQPRAELIAQHGRLMVLIGRLRLDDARASVARARALAEKLGSQRFEAENLWFLATIERLAGERAAAAAVLREAMALSRATAIGFFGPSILGSLALCTDDDAERDAALAEGEALLDAGSVSHNHFFFARDAIDAALAHRDFERALRYAARLRAYTAAESLAWSQLVIARAEALAAHGRGAANGAALAALASIARNAGQLDLLAGIEAAQRAAAA